MTIGVTLEILCDCVSCVSTQAANKALGLLIPRRIYTTSTIKRYIKWLLECYHRHTELLKWMSLFYLQQRVIFIMKWTWQDYFDGKVTNQCSSGNNNNTTLDTGGLGAPDNGDGRALCLYIDEGKDRKESEGDEEPPQDEAPDGGWGWIVAFGCFLIWVSLWVNVSVINVFPHCNVERKVVSCLWYDKDPSRHVFICFSLFLCSLPISFFIWLHFIHQCYVVIVNNHKS